MGQSPIFHEKTIIGAGCRIHVYGEEIRE